jgi:hypothetical protein
MYPPARRTEVKHPKGSFVTLEPWGEQAWTCEAEYRAYLREMELLRPSMGGVGNGDGGY